MDGTQTVMFVDERVKQLFDDYIRNINDWSWGRKFDKKLVRRVEYEIPISKSSIWDYRRGVLRAYEDRGHSWLLRDEYLSRVLEHLALQS